VRLQRHSGPSAGRGCRPPSSRETCRHCEGMTLAVASEDRVNLGCQEGFVSCDERSSSRARRGMMGS
jgi:hypothetical protein